jgi:hypothetical protein
VAQEMGDQNVEVSEADSDLADEKRVEAQQQLSEGNFDKAIELFTEAIKKNPHLAVLFAKRAQYRNFFGNKIFNKTKNFNNFKCLCETPEAKCSNT